MVGQSHNDLVMWTSLLNKNKGWASARAEALESLFSVVTSPGLTGFCCHGTSPRVWWHTFYGELGPGVVEVIYSAACAALSAIWNSLLRLLSPRSQQRGGNSYTRYSPAWLSLPSMGEIILMCQLFQWAETWWLWREHNERACCCESTTNYRLHLQIEMRTKAVCDWLCVILVYGWHN